MTYFNTTHVVGKKLYEYTKKANSQEEKILRLFLSRPEERFSPTDVWRQVFRQTESIRATVPITSIRRAITNLANHGDIYKTDVQKRGSYGRYEYCWRLDPIHAQGDLFK